MPRSRTSTLGRRLCSRLHVDGAEAYRVTLGRSRPLISRSDLSITGDGIVDWRGNDMGDARQVPAHADRSRDRVELERRRPRRRCTGLPRARQAAHLEVFQEEVGGRRLVADASRG
jgi:hypothetical protein